MATSPWTLATGGWAADEMECRTHPCTPHNASTLYIRMHAMTRCVRHVMTGKPCNAGNGNRRGPHRLRHPWRARAWWLPSPPWTPRGTRATCSPPAGGFLWMGPDLPQGDVVLRQARVCCARNCTAKFYYACPGVAAQSRERYTQAQRPRGLTFA